MSASGASSSAPTIASCHGRDENGRRKDDEWPRLPLPNDSGETGPSPVMAPRQISRIRRQLPGKWFRGRSAKERVPSRNWCPFLSARAKAAGQKGKNGEVLLRAATYSSFDALPPSLPLPPSPSPAAFLYSVPSLVPDSPDSPIDQPANVRERTTTDR